MKELCAGMTREGTECSKLTKHIYCHQHAKPTKTIEEILQEIKERAGL